MKVEYVAHMGTDMMVAEAARVSFSSLADGYTEAQNNNLILYLATGMRSSDWAEMVEKGLHTHEEIWYAKKTPTHWVPFAHPHITLRMSAPVPIRTQCFKHKQGLSESEESRRYISSTPEIYIPEFRLKAEDVKQGSADELHPDHEQMRADYITMTTAAVDKYLEWIAAGVCPEVARFLLPQGAQVNWVWTGSLYAFANFFIHRADSHAQKEIQELALLVQDVIRPLFPVSWSALTTGKLP